MSESWLRFWDRPHHIYVNDRHLRVHYARIADEILSILPDRGSLSVLDFGCGEALDAARVAARAARLYLYDGAPSVRARLARRFANSPRIAILDQAGLDALPDNSLDVIVAFSVIQYIDRAELPGLLAGWRSKLAVGGFVILADVIPPKARLLDDIGSLLSTARAYGFLLAALGGLLTTLFSEYRRLRHQIGLATYDEPEVMALLRDAGLAPIPHPRNLGFNQARRTYLGRRL
ncbi:MAG TPA: class I SAM-dependent methyltransferase [Alphaproteobacteria bacterium]|nr:class I SAM-dependent methyltransferase [Alphaproteobacteria bacterium]